LAYSVIYGLLFIFADPLVVFITGASSPMAVLIIRILGFSIIPICAGLFYSELLLIPFGYLRDYAKLRAGSLLLYLTLLLILFIINSTGVVQLSFTVVIVETFVFAYSYILAYRNIFSTGLSSNNH
jgi:hypothetical protein